MLYVGSAYISFDYLANLVGKSVMRKGREAEKNVMGIQCTVSCLINCSNSGLHRFQIRPYLLSSRLTRLACDANKTQGVFFI